MIHIRCFGGISIEGPENGPIYFRSRKHVALLTYLVANRNRAHGRDELIRLFWDSPPASARHSLSQALYDVKRRLGGLSVERFGDGLRLTSTFEFDGRLFEHAVKRGDIRSAVGLYRGDFAAAYDKVGTEEFECWVDDERRRYRILAQAALHRYVEQCDGRGDWGEMCLAALKLVKIDPISERAHGSLMRALWLHGDQASALRHFSDVEESLSRNVPGGISEETRDLVRRIRSSAPPVPKEIARNEPPMVGREKEFSHLRDLVTLAGAGEGSLAVVRGEPGIGKTRLAAELGRCVSVEGVRLLQSRCYAAEENVAYGPVVDGLRSFSDAVCAVKGTDGPLYPHLRQLLRCEPDMTGAVSLEADLAGERRRLYEEVVGFMRRLCESQTTLWVVDDVHWVDGSSASLLSYLARRLRDRRFLLLVTVRDDADLSAACRKLLRDRSTDEQAATLTLGPLSLEAVRALVKGQPGAGDGGTGSLAQRIHKLSGGNPFYVLELLRDAGTAASPEAAGISGEAVLSDRVRGLLQTRLQGLAPSSIRLLEAVAVLGRNATPGHAADAGGLTLQSASDVSDELYARGILRDHGDRLEFAHDISREFVYHNLGGVRRASLHLFVAEALASDVQATLPTIARHFHLGGDRARAFEYAIRAARASISSFGHEEAKAMATLALSQASTDAERHTPLDIIGRSALALGQLTEAEQHFEEISKLQDDVSPSDRVHARLLQGYARLEHSDWDGLSEVLQSAEFGSLPPADQYEARLSSLSLLLKAAMRQLNADLAHRLIGELRETHAIAQSEDTLTDAAAARSYYSMAAYAAFFESVGKADELVTKAWSRCKGIPEELEELAVRILLLRGLIKSHRTKWDEATVFFRHALSRSREKNRVLETGIAWNSLAFCALEQAQWADAERCCRASIEIYDQLTASTYVTATPLTNLGDTFFYQSFARKAIPVYQQALRETRPDLRPPMLASLGLAALQIGDYPAAIQHWDSLEEMAHSELAGLQERFKVAWLGAYMLAASNPALARRLLDEAAEEQRDLNVGAHLKLLWLRALLCDGDLRQERASTRDVVGDLGEAKLGWFVPFTRRWLTAARANNAG